MCLKVSPILKSSSQAYTRLFQKISRMTFLDQLSVTVSPPPDSQYQGLGRIMRYTRGAPDSASAVFICSEICDITASPVMLIRRCVVQNVVTKDTLASGKDSL